MSDFEYPVKHLSNSSIKLYNDCPFAFKAKYILKMKQPSNEHFALGKAVHGAAEFQSKYYIENKQHLDLNKVLEKYQEIATTEAESLNSSAIKAFREIYVAGHDLVEQLYEYQMKRPPIRVEQFFIVNLGYDLPLLGYIDVIFKDDALRDYKTASKPWPRSKLDNELQFTIYNEAYNILFGRYPKTLGTIELDKKLIKADPNKAIREQLTSRGGRHKEILDLQVDRVIKGMQVKSYPRCGKSGCWACSVM